MAAEFSSTPPARHPSTPSLRVAEMRRRIGRVDCVLDWQRAVSLRDPVTLLKRSHPHVNRATFKLHEILARLFSDEHRAGSTPRTAAFLAEAPGGFLYCARQRWPECECHAMSSTAPDAIAFAHADDPAIVRDLPCASDLRRAEVEAALVERCGAATIEFVSADGGSEVSDLDAAEQHSTPLALAQAATALRLQSQGGVFVLKVFEGCTLVTRQLFEVLRPLYGKIMLFKPRSSKVCNSERYVVAIGLKSPAVAREVAQRLRSVVERCGEDDEQQRFVASLGVEVSEATHAAFDRMAEEQASNIATLLACLHNDPSPSTLRSAAAKEARDIQGLFEAYDARPALRHARGAEHDDPVGKRVRHEAALGRAARAQGAQGAPHGRRDVVQRRETRRRRAGDRRAD